MMISLLRPVPTSILWFLVMVGLLGAKPPEVRFLAQAVPENLGPVAVAVEGGLASPFDLPVNHLSQPQKAAERSFDLWSVDRKVSLASITLPEDGESFIILLIPSTKGGYLPVVVPSRDSSFQGGDIYLYNLSRNTILGYVGKTRFSIQPDEGRVLRPTGARAERFYDVGIGVREGKQDRVLVTTRWPEDPQMRNYVFFFHQPETGRVTYRAVDEFVDPEAE